MELSYLGEFVALGRSRSFIDTANYCHISQSNLSKHISKLEDDFGCVLVDRKNNNLLTKEGRIVFDMATAIISEYEGAQEKIKVLRTEASAKPLKVCGYLSIKDIFRFVKTLEQMLVSNEGISLCFQKEHLSTNVAETTLFDSRNLVKSGRADIGFIVGCEDDFSNRHFESVKCLDIPFELYGNSDFAAKLGTVSLYDLREYRFLCSQVYPTCQDQVIKRCKTAGFVPRIREIYVFDSPEELVNYCQDDELFWVTKSGRGYLPQQDNPKVSRIDLVDPLAYFEVRAFWSHENCNPSLDSLLQYL